MKNLLTHFRTKNRRYAGVVCLGLLCLYVAYPTGNALAQKNESVLPDFLQEMQKEREAQRQAQGEQNRQAVGAPAADFDFLPSPSSYSGADSLGMFGATEFDFEKTPEQLEEEARREAFDAALQGLLPLRPNEIRQLLEHFDRTQESVETPVYPAPKPEVAVQTLSLDPGSKPTTIKVAHGYVTTLNIVDSTGSPWPIEDITWAGNFEVVEFGSGQASHFIRITPQSEFAYGNMSIHMLELQTPIIISLETSRDIVHYRFDAIVPRPGPFADVPLIESGISITAGSIDMTSILEGIPPQGAKRLAVSGVDGRTTAYQHGDMTYLRTPLTLLSPAWTSSTSSADGMQVYAMKRAPVVLLSEKGRMVRARLSDREDVFE